MVWKQSCTHHSQLLFIVPADTIFTFLTIFLPFCTFFFFLCPSLHCLSVDISPAGYIIHISHHIPENNQIKNVSQQFSHGVLAHVVYHNKCLLCLSLPQRICDGSCRVVCLWFITDSDFLKNKQKSSTENILRYPSCFLSPPSPVF